MKKGKISGACLLAAFLFLSGCKNDPDNSNNQNNANNANNQNGQNNTNSQNDNDTTAMQRKTIDPLLVGGYWIQIKRYYYSPERYYYYSLFPNSTKMYKFMETSFSTCTRATYEANNFKFTPETTAKAYSKDGGVYSNSAFSLNSNDILLFSYKTNAYPPYLDSDFNYIMERIDRMQSESTIPYYLQIDGKAGKIISITSPESSEETYYLSTTGRLHNELYPNKIWE